MHMGQFTFDVKIYHPGINEEGQICIPLLGNEVSRTSALEGWALTGYQWKPATSMLDGG